MRKLGILTAFLVLASCGGETEDDAPTGQAAADVPTIPEGEFLPASEFDRQLSTGSQWCFSYSAVDNSCLGVARFNRFTENGLIIDWIAAAGFEGKYVYRQRMERDGDRSCEITSDVDLQTFDVFQTDNLRADILPTDVSIRYNEDGSRNQFFENMRDDMMSALAAEGEIACWEYFLANSPTQGLATEILFREYVDGVLQPDNFSENRGAFFPADAELMVRPE